MNLLLKPAHSLAWQILRNQADAEDVVQEAFLLLWRSSENFEGNSSLKTYFTKIVMNECYSFIRKNPKYAETEVTNDHQEESSNFEFDLRLNQQIVQQALDTLTAKQRMVLVLWAFHDMTASEIGQVMNLNKNSVDQLIWRAKTALREKLAER
jgi:RNA polymerase sigma-70 factor (ECF subfamily)